MPAEITTAITAVANAALSSVASAVVHYWPYIIGVSVLLAIGFRFRRLFGLAR